MNISKLENLSHELDSNCGALSGNQETLKNIKTELDIISERIRETDRSNMTAMAMQFHDITHSIQILDDLMEYTTNEIDTNLQNTVNVKENLFSAVLKGND